MHQHTVLATPYILALCSLRHQQHTMPFVDAQSLAQVHLETGPRKQIRLRRTGHVNRSRCPVRATTVDISELEAWCLSLVDPCRCAASIQTSSSRLGSEQPAADEHALGPAAKAPLRSLEWPRLCEHIAQFAATHAGRQAVLDTKVGWYPSLAQTSPSDC